MDGTIPVLLSDFVTKTKEGNTKGALMKIDEPEESNPFTYPHLVKGTHESVLAVWRPCVVVHLAKHGQGCSLRVFWGLC